MRALICVFLLAISVPGFAMPDKWSRPPDQGKNPDASDGMLQFVRRLDDPEAEPGRRDPLEVAGVGEERERLLERDGDDLAALEGVLRHAAARWSCAQAASRPR